MKVKPVNGLALRQLIAFMLLWLVTFPATALGQDQTTTSVSVQDIPLAPEDRARALVSQMTVEEKVSQIDDDAAAIPRLGVPAYHWWNEGLHGVARQGIATVFPQAIGLAATFDGPLVKRIGDAIGTEFRAKYSTNRAADGSSRQYQGLTVWSPNINIFRDPRWGRGQETYGEDPYLAARTGVAFISGLQGPDPEHPRTIATAKHYAVHSGPEHSRHTDNFNPSARDLEETYLPAFRAAVTEAKVRSVMCAYNRVYLSPACANEFLLDQTLRRDWGFAGYVVSDCGAVHDIHLPQRHAYVGSAADAATVALEAGMDLVCGWFLGKDPDGKDPLVQAVHDGLLDEDVLDRAVVRLFAARFALGMFDPPIAGTPSAISVNENDTSANRKLNQEAARKSLVLLRNEDGLLPIRSAPRKIAVVGPNADTVEVLIASYHGDPSAPVTILDGLRARFPDSDVVHYPGSGLIERGEMMIPASALCLDAICTQRGLSQEVFAGTGLDTEVVSMSVTREARYEWYHNKGFAVRWKGYLIPPHSGTYDLRLDHVDGYRIEIGSDIVLDHWDGQGLGEDAGNGAAGGSKGNKVRLEGGRSYPLTIVIKPANQWGVVRSYWRPETDPLAEALAGAADADLVVLAVGLSPRIEDEELKIKVPGFDRGDRTTLDLPAVQQELVERLSALGKPTVLVLTNGSALAVNWADAHVPAILEAWYPGGEGGQAVAEAIAGDFSPAGRLPVTFYKGVEQLPDFRDYSMAGRTYRYFEGEPLYPFGYGLSYSTFDYSRLRIASPDLAAGAAQQVSVSVTNTGAMDSDEVVQLYLSHPDIVGAPIRSLAGYQRVYLTQGETREVTFELDSRELSTVDEDGNRAVRPGRIEVWVGGGQNLDLPNIPQTAGVSGQFSVHGQERLPR